MSNLTMRLRRPKGTEVSAPGEQQETQIELTGELKAEKSTLVLVSPRYRVVKTSWWKKGQPPE